MTGGSTATTIDVARRRIGAAAVAVTAVLAGLLVAPGADAQASPTVPVLHLEGRGFGHGVGLSQWGARYMADDGADVGTILATFYPGTALASGAGGDVRVRVLDAADGRATLSFPDGGEVRSAPAGPQAPGFPVAVGPGGSVQIRHDGRYYVEAVVGARSTAGGATLWRPGAATTAAAPGDEAAQCIPLLGACPPPEADPGGCALGCPQPAPPPSTAPPPPPPGPGAPPTPPPPVGGAPAPTPTAPPPTAAPGDPVAPPAAVAPVADAPLWAVPAEGSTVGVTARERSYRGVVQAVAGRGGLGLVNQVDLERYLAGMAEVPTSWPAAVQEAQAVAARTYALRAMAASGEICDTQRCQVYGGAAREHPNQTAAVEATRGQVLTHGGELAAAVYSADAGGVSATTLEGFGTPDGVYPYLTTVAYDTPDPLPWSTDIALTDVAARTDYPGTLADVRVATAGPSGRALELVLEGDAGPRSVSGLRFASALGLRSTLFVPTVGTGAAPPPPPLVAAADGVAQALPGESVDAGGAPEVGLPADRATARRPTTPSAPTVVDEEGATDRRPAALAAATVLAGAVALAVGVGRGPAGAPLATLAAAGRARFRRPSP